MGINMDMEVILATPRSGSSFIGHQLSVETGEEWRNEIFNQFAWFLSPEDITANIAEIQETKSGVIKVFPDDFPYCMEQDFDLYKFIAENVDTLHVTYRKDFNAQLQSFYIAAITENWQDPWDVTYDVPLEEMYYKKLGNILTILLTVQVQIINAILAVAPIEIKLYCLEDYATPEHKLHRPVKWIDEPPTIEFDTAKLFKNW